MIRPPPSLPFFPTPPLSRPLPEHVAQGARVGAALVVELALLGDVVEVQRIGVSLIVVRHGATHADQADTDPLKDRKSTRLNSSHSQNSYSVFCLEKKKNKIS